MVPTKVLYQHLLTFSRVGNSSNRMLNVITCSMTGMDRVTTVKNYGGQEKSMEGLNQQVLTSVKPTA